MGVSPYLLCLKLYCRATVMKRQNQHKNRHLDQWNTSSNYKPTHLQPLDFWGKKKMPRYTVMINIDYQLDKIYNHLGIRLLSVSVNDRQFIEFRRPTQKAGNTTPWLGVAACMKAKTTQAWHFCLCAS